VFADPQVIARGMKVELDGVAYVRSPFVFSDADLTLKRGAPKLGQDN
jgi:crotonobetainyl-CoA:carnitine CoA-transferase CaiB-like acyl-CoA transferase